MYNDISHQQSLNFIDYTIKAFNFLVTEYGFCCIKKESYFDKGYEEVVFESRKVRLSIIRETYSYEVYCSLSLIRDQSEYTLFRFQASTKERMEKFMPEMANTVRKEYEAALLGEKEAICKIYKTAKQDAEQYWKSFQRRSIIEKLAKAWHEKDFVKVVDICESIPLEYLTSVEKKKLQYAKKQLNIRK